ncbi:MAG: DUF1122 family protein [Terriglobia bacterium]
MGLHTLRVARLAPGEKSGWTRFHLVLEGKQGEFVPPVVEAIYSAGGRGVLPWIEVLAYQPKLRRSVEALELAAHGWDVTLFTALGKLIPPGGHIMVGCETPPHQETYQALLKGVPPAATPLGSVLFRAGFRKVKFFYLAEGGWEGQQKLWAEKPIAEPMRLEWDAATAGELRRFLSAPTEAPAAARCRPRAAALLKELEASEARKNTGG